MATVMKQHQSHHVIHPRSMIQKFCIGTGIFLVATGFIGVLVPGFLEMHLSFSHDVIHLVTGSLAIWCGYADSPKKSFGYSIGLGIFFGLIGLAGFVIGEPGYPSVGNMEADNYLFRVLPNVLEFGSMDHVVHLLLAAVLLFSAYAWSKNRDNQGRFIVDTQAGKNLNRRSDNERKI